MCVGSKPVSESEVSQKDLKLSQKPVKLDRRPMVEVLSDTLVHAKDVLEFYERIKAAVRYA